MSSDKTIYDELIPFFGNAKDQRVRLYLHTFLHSDLDTQSCRFLQHSKIWEDKGGNLTNTRGGILYKLDNNVEPDDKTTNNNNNAIDPEWLIFVEDVARRLTEDGKTPSRVPGMRGSFIPPETGKTFGEDSEPVKVLNNLVKGGVRLSFGKLSTKTLIDFLMVFIDQVNGINKPLDVKTLKEVKSIKFLDYGDLIDVFIYQLNSCATTFRIRGGRDEVDIPLLNAVINHNPFNKYKGRETFTYKIGKDVALAILTETKEEKITVSPSGSKFLDSLEMDSTTPSFEYYRKPSDPSKLYTKDKFLELITTEFYESSKYLNKSNNDTIINYNKLLIQYFKHIIINNKLIKFNSGINYDEGNLIIDMIKKYEFWD